MNPPEPVEQSLAQPNGESVAQPILPQTARMRRRHAARILARSLLGLAILLTLLACLLFAAIVSRHGTRAIWKIAGQVVPGTLTGTVVGGTLADGLELRNVLYRDSHRTIRLDHVIGVWHLSLAPRRLDIASLQIDNVDVTLLPSPANPLRLPEQITLPIPITLQRAQIGTVLLHEGASDSRYSDLRFHASTDRIHHQVVIANALAPFGTLNGTLQLEGSAPFALRGNLGLIATYLAQHYHVDATIGGTLGALRVQAKAAGGALDGSADIDATPFDPIPLRRAHITLAHLDPKVFNPAAPHADLAIDADLAPVSAPPAAGQPFDVAKLVVSGPVVLNNARAGSIDRGLLPLASARAQVTLGASSQQLDQLRLVLPGGATLAGAGTRRSSGEASARLEANGLDLHALHALLKPTRLHGPLDISAAGGVQSIVMALTSATLSVNAEARVDAQQVMVRSARVQIGASQLALSGSLGRDAQARYAIKGSLKDFDPAAVMVVVAPRAPSKPAVKAAPAHINMAFEADGVLQPEFATRVRFGIHDSTYDNLPMTGGGSLQLIGKRVVASDATISVAGNNASIKGGFGTPADRLDFRIAAPALERLGFGLAGAIEASGRLAGTFAHPVVDATYMARGLVVGANRLVELAGQAHVDGMPGENADARMVLQVNARGVRSGSIELDRIDLKVDGTTARHAIAVTSVGRLGGQPLALTLAAQGAVKALPQGYAWDGVLQTLENQGVPRLAIGNPVSLSAAPGRLVLGATRLTLGPATVDLKGLQIGPGMLGSQGSFSALQLADVLALQQKFTGQAPPFKTTLALDGSWNFKLTDSATGFVRLERRSGDIVATTPYGESALGITALNLQVDMQGTRAVVASTLDAARIGSLTAQATVGLVLGDTGLHIDPTSALSANFTGVVPRLRSLGVLAGPQVALDGSLNLKLTAAGTLGAPKFSGTVDGDQLALTLFDQGVRLKDGIARISLDNNFVDLREVVFHGGAGTLRATGRIPLAPGAQDLTASIIADHLELLSDPSRQLILSGQAKMSNVSQQLQVNGRFTVDRALFSLPEKSAPTLSDDVVIVHQGATPKRVAPAQPAADQAQGMAGLLPPKVAVVIELGNNFRFKGAGADIFLGGELDVRSGPGQPAQAFGNVRVVSGVYEAFGAKLAIERGVISFQGPFDNPSINILAMRRNQAVPAGVQVTGNVRQPRVELVSEPNLADEEKLSWLVFGRAGSASSGQAQGAVQGAALGLLNKFGGATIASRVGLDQLSLGTSEYGKSGAQVVNLGKEISKKLYVGYEQGLAGAGSVAKLTYELTQSWSLVVRGGAVAGVDVRYNRRFDRLWGAAPVVAVP